MQQVLGGSEIQCDLIARGLHKRGHNITYIAPGNKLVDSSALPYRVELVGASAREIADRTLASRPDVVYWRFNKNNFFHCARSISKAKIPFVFAVSDPNDVSLWPVGVHLGWKEWIGHQRRTLQGMWERQGFRYVTMMTLLNSDLYGRVRGVPQTYIPNAMIQSKVAFDWPRNFCTWIANIKARKRPEKFVELASSLENTGIDCIMIGNMQSRDYEWLSDPARVPGNFHYIGPRSVEEVNGVLAGSLFHVHTCAPEGFGNVFIQAWLQGRPSISLGYDPAGYIKQYEIGIDAKEHWATFVEAAQHYTTDKNAREEAGARARRFADAMFSPDRMVGQVEDLLLKAARREVGHTEEKAH